jgi:YHS domain-containing protein
VMSEKVQLSKYHCISYYFCSSKHIQVGRG